MTSSTDRFYFAIPVPLSPDTNRSKINRLKRIATRDKRVLRYLTYVIKDNQEDLLTRNKIRKFKLHNLILSSRSRKYVKYNIKKQYQGYTREFQELRDNAVESYHSYLANKKNGKTGLPYHNGNSTLFTRRMNHSVLKPNGNYTTGTSKILHDPSNLLTPLWVEIYDTFNSNHLILPLKFGKKLVDYMRKVGISFDDVKTINFSRDSKKQWICNLTFKVSKKKDLKELNRSDQVVVSSGVSGNIFDDSRNQSKFIPRPSANKKEKIAILGLDPGITRPYTGFWLTPHGFKRKFERYYSVPAYENLIYRLDRQIAQRQQKLNVLRDNANTPYARTTQLKHALIRAYKKREKIRQEAEHHLANILLAEVLQWKKKGWRVYVAVGYPKYISKKLGMRRKDNTRKVPRWLRKNQYRWKYLQRIEILERKFSSYGLDGVVIATDEHYTSRTCPKCCVTEFRRFSSFEKNRKYGTIFRHGGWFECQRCNFKCNADVMGAINIAKGSLLCDIYTPGEKTILEYQRRQNWWIYENYFQRRLRRYVNAKKKGARSVKKHYEQWDTIKKKQGWQLKPLYWLNYPTKQVPKSYQIWVKRLQPPPKIPT